MLLERSVLSHGIVVAAVVVVVEMVVEMVEILVAVVRLAMTRLLQDVQHLIRMTAVSLVMSAVITRMIAHARVVVVTVEDTKGQHQDLVPVIVMLVNVVTVAVSAGLHLEGVPDHQDEVHPGEVDRIKDVIIAAGFSCFYFMEDNGL